MQGGALISWPWQLAATPAERRQHGRPVCSDPAHAERRYAFWRQLGWVAADPASAGARFSALDLSEPEFERMFGEDPDALAARLGAPPSWFETFVAALADAPADEEERDERDERQGELLADEEAVLLVFEPFIVRAAGALAERLHAIVATAPAELSSLVDLADRPPCARISRAAQKTLLLEFKVASLRGEIEGDGVLERYGRFVASLAQPGPRELFFAEYPVLVRLVVEVLDQWVRRTAELAERLIADRDALAELIGHAGALVDVDPGEGDVHKDGQSVAILTFEHAKVVYKPRSLVAEQVVERLVAWFNRRAPRHELRALRVLDREAYGWSEFISNERCAEEDAAAFHWRAGALLALLHGLWGVDFHRENLIAAGPHPVAIDCETLCHPSSPDVAGSSPSRSSDPVEAFLDTAVHRVGLLPSPTLYRDDEDAWQRSDYSALVDGTGQGAPLHGAEIAVDGDELRMRRKRPTLPRCQNRSTTSSPTAFIAEILDGFRTAYRALAAGRDELLAPGGLLDWLRGAELRIVLRPTMYYERLQDDSVHPDLLRDAVDRAICLDRLWSGASRGGDPRVIEDEIRQLVRGDVPFFTVRPELRDLVLADGDHLADVLPVAPLVLLEERLRELGEDDLARQSQLVALTLGCFDPASVVAHDPASSLDPGGSLLAAAGDVAARLLALMHDGGGRVGWLGASSVADDIWIPGPVGDDLYGGLAGVGLFLAAYGRAAGDPLALAVAARIGDQIVPGAAGVGAMTGAGGALYALGNLTRLLRTDRWLPSLRGIVETLRLRCPDDTHADIVDGASGALLALLSVSDLVEVEGAAAAAAGRLLATQERSGGWVTPAAPRALAGMGHGASGIALALARWHEVSADPRAGRAVRAALAFVDAHANAPATGWCHGAQGIALARHAVDGVADASPPATLGNDGLCHGDLGDLEILRVTGRRDLAPAYVATLERARSRGWRSGDAVGVTTPGLMNGLAGIGLALVGAAAPASPSVLLLEPLSPLTMNKETRP